MGDEELRVWVFPARAGMNRTALQALRADPSVPRPRGDEPFELGDQDTPRRVFPARAGMNRRSGFALATSVSVPRPRGDEPVVGPAIEDVLACSPPARG